VSREDERERDIVALRTTAERSAAAASTTAEGKMNPSKNQPDEIAQLARDLVDRSPEPLASLECQADFAESVSQADRVWLDRRLAASRRVLDRDHPSRAPRWVPTLYAAMGLPYALVAGVAATMLRDMNMPDDQITLHLGGIGVVWSLKPLWAPLLGIAWTKREWILLMQGCLAGLFACLALLLGTNAHGLLFAVLWLVAPVIDHGFNSVTLSAQGGALSWMIGASWGWLSSGLTEASIPLPPE
jgi:hypothetical protein